MPMKRTAFFILAAWFSAAALQATPKFWNDPKSTPTPPQAPEVQPVEEPQEYKTATPTPVIAPMVEIGSPTPTPQPGLSPKNPTQAALFSVVIPGSGHVYAGDPLKGLAFATVFGLSFWQTLDNLQTVSDGNGNLTSRNETAGNLFGLAALAAYGFGIQDAYNTAVNYNKRNYLTFHLGVSPRPNAALAFLF